MIAPCESISKDFLPALKLATAKKLFSKGVTQMRIAELLGITQAQVSKYLSGVVSGSIVEMASSNNFENKAELISKLLLSDKKVHEHTCNFCESFNNHTCYLRLVV